METIILYASLDLRSLDRGNQIDTLDFPQDELRTNFEYIVGRDDFRAAYRNWNRDEHPILKLHDRLSDLDIYIGRPSAERIREAIQKNEPSVQLF